MRRPNGISLDVVMQELRPLYHPPKTFLHFRTPLDLLVAVILSAQCTDACVNIVTEKILYPKYKTARDYVRVRREELEQDIFTCGTYRMKAKHIQEMAHLLLQRHGGDVPRTMDELTALPGVGRKTANVILSAAFDINNGIAVDTHVLRLSRRLGLSDQKTPEKIEQDLIKASDRKDWRNVTVYLISHGRAVCTALSRKCEQCVFQDRCPSSKTRGKRDLAEAGKKQVSDKRVRKR